MAGKIHAPNPPSLKTAEKVAEVKRLRDKGWTFKAIAKRMGASDTAVARWYHDEVAIAHGLPRASPALSQARRDAEARLAEVPPDTRPLGARLLGDPVFERSALYQKLRGQS